MKALEFYSGIGARTGVLACNLLKQSQGLHLALSRSHGPTHAFDWDQIACEVYSANFGSAGYHNPDRVLFGRIKGICVVACQPYTTVLPELARNDSHPSHLLTENVADFETSTTRKIFVTALRIWNSEFPSPVLPSCQESAFHFRDIGDLNGDDIDPLRYIPGRGSPWIDPRSAEPSIRVEEIRRYLDPKAENGSNAIPDKILRKWGRLFDVVLPSSRRTCCFTRGYTQLVERSGSILQMNESQDTTSIFNMFLHAQSSSDESVATESVRTLDSLRLRYFSPDELLQLFSFTPLDSRTPSTQPFIWPDGVSRKTKYRLIGNSVNVRVVQELLSFLFKEP
ncbi:S-adenosyl-L-methionine-dependent methyltransferase [Mycena rebaudengoi]|nr:S-adenosyl-L-methionine-dependent methyltransferase [Mycena rebaudengoi]